MPTNKKVAIYTTPTCTYCRQTKEFFKASGVGYEEHNVFTDLARRQEMVTKSGQMGVPVITVSEADGSNESVVVGYNRAKLADLLGL
ncbi:MAG: glutaredoxin domain-containing protein [Patescibacteria group bacterium]